jgi:hypothetical protein
VCGQESGSCGATANGSAREQPTARSLPCYGSEYSSRRRSFLIDAHRYESFKSVKIICNSVPGLRLATDMNPTQSVPLGFRNYLASAVGAPDLCGRQVRPWFRGTTLRTAFQGARELELMVRLAGTSRIDFCLCVPGHEWVAAAILQKSKQACRGGDGIRLATAKPSCRALFYPAQRSRS